MKEIEDKNWLEESVGLLKRLISIPSFSDEESQVAYLWESWLKEHGVPNVERFHNNIYALTSHYDPTKPILLLNSHMDTVKPVESYTRDPFNPVVEEGRLYGLGSNDAGGCGVALAATFLKFKDRDDLPFNLLLAISAGEERMTDAGMRALLPHLKEKNIYPDMAIVGEPTGCQAAIGERGLVVCDAYVKGTAGHAARNTGINALYRAIDDINRLREIKWDKESEILGPLKVTITMIDSGTQHNIVPDKCHYVVDVRTTDAYSNEETVALLNRSTEWSELIPRSTRIRASAISPSHPLVKAAINAGAEPFISPTTSDMGVMYDIPSLKIGPGRSERSHTADEYIELQEIKEGLLMYTNILESLSETII